MNPLRWFTNPRTKRPLNEVVRKTDEPLEETVRSVVGSLPYAWKEAFPGHHRTVAAIACGWTISLHVSCDKDAVLCVTTFDYRVERDWLQRQLALALLEANSRIEWGSFRVIEKAQGCTFLLGQRCDPRHFDAPAIAVVCRKLVSEMDHAIRQLYSLEFLDRGPHEDAPAPVHS